MDNHQLAVDGDCLKELKAFDDTKSGVKGLVDGGIASVPKIFILPPEDQLVMGINIGHLHVQLPVIDLSEIKTEDKRKSIDDETRRASEEWGFFHVLNHGIPRSVLDGMIEGTRKFHEHDAQLKHQILFS
ncbi:1-aminocyclopropane-1-carboxylate oxidase homolog [Coffea arabica]|uniref:1-aminocyclopropane-1-carboxylate oxidase homolog n=1 Tax=Coffea arabica TaxID=13443 RepID=A0ABM4X714_COFAR